MTYQHRNCPAGQHSLSHSSNQLLSGGAWEPPPLCAILSSCPSPAPTALHWGHSRGQMSFENQFPAHSLAAQSSNFEGHGEQLHSSCFSCRCDLARHVHVPPQSSSLQTEGPQPRPSIWCCVWRNTTYQNRLVVFNRLLSISKICTLIIHLIYLG